MKRYIINFLRKQMKDNPYEPCHLHQNEYLQIICQQCQQACLACPMCIDQFHSGHSMISLKKFISSEIPKLYKTKPSLQKTNKGIQSMREGFLEGFEGMRKRIGQQINEIQEMYNLEAERMKKQIEVVCGQGTYSLQSITAIKHKLKLNLKIPEQDKLQAEFGKILFQVSSLLSETTENICKSIKELREYWELSCGVILNSKSKVKHHFSPQKHELIELKSKKAQKKWDFQGQQEEELTIAINKAFDSKYHIAVVEPGLNPFKNQVQFKIQESTNNCVWIGVCDLQKNCYKKNEGCYWIWQSGGEDQCQFFSSLLDESVTLENCIRVGDTILVRLEYCTGERNQISFYKVAQDQKKTRTLIHSAQIQKKKFHACVALGDELEKVSIES